ncbi:hypothetical protein SEUCBS139899_005971 [Sporothrix eucalyptigena]
MDLATLKETNRVRESMGLKPIPIPGKTSRPSGSDDDNDDDDDDEDEEEEDEPLATLDGRHAAAYDNYKKVQEAEAAKRRREEKAAAVKRVREQAQRHAVLEGKSLGDLDGEDADGDAKAWLRGQKKRQKKISKAEEKQQVDEAAAAEEAKRRRRRAAGAASDDEDADEDGPGGLKVGHDMATLLDGDDQILTLKDATVLDNEDEGDELENLGLREEEQLQERLKLKKKRPTYDPMNDDEGSNTILGQYDEEIFGKKRKHFTLDPNAILGLDGGSTSALGSSSTGAAVANGKAQQQVDIDDILSGMPSSDYLDASEIKIKKSKKKMPKTKKTRMRGGDDDEGLFPAAADSDDDNAGEGDGTTMEVDDASTAATDLTAKRRKRRVMDTEDLFRDDDDLQASLAIQRREALKKRKRLRPEDLAKQLREASAAPNGEDGEDGYAAPTIGGLVIDETAEFINNLKRREDHEDDTHRPRKQARKSSVTAMEENDDEDANMKDEDADGDDPRYEREGSTASNIGAGGLEDEKKISQGMGATLAILRGRGILDAEDGDEDGSGAERNARMRQHQQFITEKRVQLARLEDEARRRREHDRTSGSMSRMSVREREEYARKQNAQREFQTSRMLQDMFNKNYTPNFKLEYIDEHGRELNQKEAFRALSHGFHGKTSGSGKTDKMLKKIEAEKRHMAEGILDASQNVGMSSATAQQLKKRKEAGIRLD